MRGRQAFPFLGTANIPKFGFCLLTVVKGDARVREMFNCGCSFRSCRSAHNFKFFFLTEKQIHVILTHWNKMCSESQRFPPNPTPQWTTIKNWLYSLYLDGSSSFMGTEVQSEDEKISEMKAVTFSTRVWINLMPPNWQRKIISSICPGGRLMGPIVF